MRKLNLSDEQQRQAVVEKMWLNYYNNTLLEKGLITQQQHRKMQTIISARKPTSAK